MTRTITCTVVATASEGSASSVSAGVQVGGAPSGGVATVVGSDKVGSSLSCLSGGWTAMPGPALSYVWLRNGAPVANGVAYTTTPADAGAQVACRATAVNTYGSGTATSPPVTVVAAPPAIALAGALVKPGAKLATVSCDVGPCTTSAPQKVQVKIGGKSYPATVFLPSELAAGASGKVTVELGKAARKALKKAGKSAKFGFKVSATGGGGTTTSQISAQLT